MKETTRESRVTNHGSPPLRERLALHHWTLETTPLADFLRIARDTGWNAVELRRSSFTKCFDTGMTNGQVIDLIRSSGIEVAVLGTEYGLFFAKGEEQKRLLKVLDETCANAVALGCDLVMCAEGFPGGTVRDAGANIREAAEVCRAHDVRFAFEFSSAATAVNSLEIAREVLALADHPNCGLLLDAYHLERTGRGGRGFEDVPARDIFAFQYSDVPPTPLPETRRPADRLPPGRGVVRWREAFQLLTEKGYQGHISYEAPNPAHWARPPEEVAREGAAATRALLAQVGER
jgi:sugar phosphate isomerase/epimerase